MRYVFDIYYWGEWSFEKEFDSLDRAKRFAETFPEDQWRIVDNGNVILEHDPLAELERQAALNLGRFARSDEWNARQRTYTRPGRYVVGVQPPIPSHSIVEILRGHYPIAPRPCFSDKVNWLEEGF